MTTASLRRTMNHRVLLCLFRSSHRSCSVEKCFLKNLANFPSQQNPCVESLFNSVAGRSFICERLLLFVSPQSTIANSSGEFGPDETSTECKVSIFLKRTEAVARRCSVKRVFLEISQNSHENTCARSSLLIKLQ